LGTTRLGRWSIAGERIVKAAPKCDEVELDRLVTALPEKYGHLSEDVAIEKILAAFPGDEVRRQAALGHLGKIRSRSRILRGGVVTSNTPQHDQRRTG
jgi:hypothetical protein